VVEFLDRITPGMDNEVSKDFMRVLKKQGIEFKMSTKASIHTRRIPHAQAAPTQLHRPPPLHSHALKKQSIEF
jgi:pyruvate/2-oxoglutarate dehydrogenase complex dihydrolipoamide dehydrogenase (E3) component